MWTARRKCKLAACLSEALLVFLEIFLVAGLLGLSQHASDYFLATLASGMIGAFISTIILYTTLLFLDRDTGAKGIVRALTYLVFGMLLLPALTCAGSTLA